MLFQITGTPWTTDMNDKRINVTDLDTFFNVKDGNNPQFTANVQQTLQPGTNCTFYLCYKEERIVSPYFPLGKTSPVSCVTGKWLHAHTHTKKKCTNSVWWHSKMVLFALHAHTHMHTHTHMHAHTPWPSISKTKHFDVMVTVCVCVCVCVCVGFYLVPF